MKLLNSAEVTIARLTLSTLEARLLDLMEHESFDEIIRALRHAESARGTIAELVRTAANLARGELGVPPPKTAGEPGVQ